MVYVYTRACERLALNSDLHQVGCVRFSVRACSLQDNSGGDTRSAFCACRYDLSGGVVSTKGSMNIYVCIGICGLQIFLED